MPLAILFWMIMILWVIFLVWAGYPTRDWRFAGGGLIVFVLLAVLGWRVFGPVIQ